jgi:hypothetical protein
MTKTVHKKFDHRILFALGFFLVCVVAASAANTTTFSSPGDNGQMVIKSNVVTYDKSDLQNMYQKDSTNVINLIENMQNGYVLPGEARTTIEDKKSDARSLEDLTPEEMVVNQNYINFLNSAYDCTTAYGNYGKDSEQFTASVKEMKEKKELI